MKKVISVMLILLILLNFTLCNNAYAAGQGADDPQTNSAYFDNSPPSNGAMGQLIDEGTTPVKQGDQNQVEASSGSYGASIIGVVTGILARILNVFLALQVDLIMAQLTYGVEDGEMKYFFSIDRCVFNRVPLFNINYFDTEATYKVGETEVTASQSNIKIKEGIAGAYYISRVLAVSISLFVLIPI